ncbi:hypothetical protein MRX96_018680 [Rhipicephalus microplus]
MPGRPMAAVLDLQTAKHPSQWPSALLLGWKRLPAKAAPLRTRSGGRPASRDRLLLHGSSLDADAVVHAGEGGVRQLGDFLVVRREAAPARRRRRDDVTDSDADLYRRAPSSPVSDTFGTTRSVEYSGGSLSGVAGPRRTEILYIRSPPPEVASVAGDYREDSSSRRRRRIREDEADDSGNIRHRAAANRRENARRVRFSRYHKVDGASFVLQSHSPDGVEDVASSTSVLPRDQVWIVPQEPRGTTQRDAMPYEETTGRPVPAARNARLRAMHRRSGGDSQELETSDFGESFEECELRSKNIVANDLPQVHGGEADGHSFSRVAESSFQGESALKRRAVSPSKAEVPFDTSTSTVVQRHMHVTRPGEGTRAVQAGEIGEAMTSDAQGAGLPSQSSGVKVQTSSVTVSQVQGTVSSGTTTQVTTVTTNARQQQLPQDYRVGQPSLVPLVGGQDTIQAPVRYASDETNTGAATTERTDVSLQSHVSQAHHIQQDATLAQASLHSLGLQGPQLVAITGMSPVFFSTPLPGTQMISQPVDIAQPNYPQAPSRHQPPASTYYSTVQSTDSVIQRQQVPFVPSLVHTKQERAALQREHDQALTTNAEITTERTAAHDQITHSNSEGRVSTTVIVDNREESAVSGEMPSNASLPAGASHDESGKSRLKVPRTTRAPGQAMDADGSPMHQGFSTVKITTKVITTDGSLVDEESATHAGMASDSEMEMIERDLKTSLGKLDESEEHYSDSGIGPGAKNLRLKKNAFIEKKSLFTIAYDGVNTERIRTCLGSSSPSP